MKVIPLHSLIISIGPYRSGKTDFLRSQFPEYEIMSYSDIKMELVRDPERQDVNHIVHHELGRRVSVRLSLGQRVVVDGQHLNAKDRINLARIGKDLGIPVFYVIWNTDLDKKIIGVSDEYQRSLIEKQDITFRSCEKSILKGDGLAEVIDGRTENLSTIKEFPAGDIRESLLTRNYLGITAVGDVHGMRESLLSVIDWASTRKNWLLFLGDIVDYGPHSIECIDIVYNLVVRGKAGFVIGNHERKLERWLQQSKYNDVKIKIYDSNRATFDPIENMTRSERDRFEVKFRALLQHSRHHWVVGNICFAHGCVEPELFSNSQIKLKGPLEKKVLFGEVNSLEPLREDGYPSRVYHWVDRIPTGHCAIVGHDIRSNVRPLVEKGKLGGQAIFLDTGCAKGGKLSSVDLNVTSPIVQINNYNVH